MENIKVGSIIICKGSSCTIRKLCNKCMIEKPLQEMVKHTTMKDGYRPCCKKCNQECRGRYLKDWRGNNKEYRAEQGKIYRKINKEHIKETTKKYYKNNIETIKEYREKTKERTKEYCKEWAKNNEDKVKESHRVHYENNKEHIKEKVKEYSKNNIEKIRITKKKHRAKNIKRINEKDNEYCKQRRLNDPLFRLIHNIRSSIGSSFRRKLFSKNSKTEIILGCSFLEFKLHLESKFETWMEWGNHGAYNGDINFGWDVDHIIPTSSAKTLEDVIILNHYTNFQPLCSRINRYIKRDKI